VLRQRVVERFPIGHSDAGLEAYLKSEGMKTRRVVTPDIEDYPIFGEGRVDGRGRLCPREAIIQWRADHTGTIRELFVLYDQSTCL